MSPAQNALTPFFEQADACPEKIAIVDGSGRSINYGDLVHQSGALAAYLSRAGIKAGDRVLLALPITLDLYMAMAALWRIGAVIVFPEPALGLAGLKHAVAIARPDAFLSAGKFKFLPLISKAIRSIPLKVKLGSQRGTNTFLDHPARASDPALISFTSGSTGVPKAILRSHQFLLSQNACLTPLIGQAEPDDIDLVAFPVFVIANLAMGLTSVLPNWPLNQHDNVDPEKISTLIKSRQITRILVPPSICGHLTKLANPPELSAIFTGGGPVFPDLVDNLSETFPSADIISVYGSTEAEPIAHQHFKNIPTSAWRHMQSGGGLFAGKPIEDINIEIFDDEIIVSGDHVNKSYMNGVGDEENKIERRGEIWHRTGDAGHIDANGHLWLRGRLSAKAGSIYPFEAEVAARQWPGVDQVALIPGSSPPTLALAGKEPKQGVWQNNASKIGGLKILKLDHIPLDKRHRSKIDYTALKKILGSR